MIALMFPRDDVEARNIAVSLAMENDSLHVVPKGVFRQWHEVARVLDMADAGVLIILNPYAPLDKATLNDIRYLSAQGKNVYVLYPNNYKHFHRIVKLDNVVPLEYVYGDINSISGLIKQIQKIWQNSKSKSKGDVFDTIMIILLGVLALYGIAFLLGKAKE